MTGPSRAALAAAFLAVAALAAPGPAAAQGLLEGLMGMIGIAPEKPVIDYRERPPLVVPRDQRSLRAPEAPRAAQRNGAWPNDPDAAARQRAAEEANEPVRSSATIRNEDPLMSPRALRAGPRTATNAYRGLPFGAVPDTNSELLIQPTRQMKDADAQRQQSLSNLQPGEEPQRRSLSEPPSGYRKPTEIVRAPADPVRRDDPSSARDFIVQQRRAN